MTAVEFDFETKQERTIEAAEVPASCAAGRFCWIDIDQMADPSGAATTLRGLGVNEQAVLQALGPDSDGRHDLYDDCLHIAVTAATFEGGHLIKSHVDILIAERFLVTLRRGRVEFIEQVRRHYRQDFLKFAKSPSFLIYEYWDHLIHGYRGALRSVEAHVERVQSRIFGVVDDTIFAEVSGVTQDLLTFRKLMLAAREVLHELTSRRTAFVSETAVPSLERLAGTLERLSSDLAVEREILAETLNLYMGIVSHRTNRVVSRLTVVSMIFLPLTFLCGVYGMNFDQADGHKNPLMPELTWEHGYTMFWVLALTIAAGLLFFMKRKRWW
jgi:magnesium transporter